MTDKDELQRDLIRKLNYYREVKEGHRHGDMLHHEVEAVALHVANVLLAAVDNYGLSIQIQDAPND